MKLKKFSLAIATVGAICASGAAYANYYVKYIYYSDATHTTQVGRTITFCSGTTTTSGTVTPYKVLDDKFNCSL